MRHALSLAAVGFVLLLSACDDEIVDVDLPKDASADRAAEAAGDGAKPSNDAPSASDTADGGSSDESDSTTDGEPEEASDARTD